MERNKDDLRGETLRKLRKDRNLTQQQVADSLGLSKQAISKFEQGISYSIDTAHAFANFYNVGYDFLMANTRIGKLAIAANKKILAKKDVMDWVLERINPRIDALEKRVKELEAKL